MKSANKVVSTVSGDVAGIELDVAVYTGIPYASPPVGELRWRPPEPAQSWRGVLQATSFGRDPVQVSDPSLRSRAPGVSEDCLTLNIWTPATPRSGGYPVMVWLDGGGFVAASGAKEVLDGSVFARRGIVLVTINYRVGVFGFLAHPKLTRESPHGASGNYGFLDQILALQWVRDNIEQFGGNPECVTIFGVSAGGASAALMLISPLAEGLYHRAILESPGAFRPLCPLRVAEEAGTVVGDDLHAMRKLSSDELLRMNTRIGSAVRGLTTPRVLRPIIDGWSIDRDEVPAFQSGCFNAVPVIVGGTADEGSFFLDRLPIKTLSDYRAYVQANFGAVFADAWDLYGATSDADVAASLAAVFGDTQFTYGARGVAMALAQQEPRTYRYIFSHKKGRAGRLPTHADEVEYVFGTGTTFDERDRELSDTIMRAWIRFAETGDPNGPHLPEWPKYTSDADEHIFLEEGFPIGSKWRIRQLNFLEDYFKHSRK